jgi:hypothetical protein
MLSDNVYYCRLLPDVILLSRTEAVLQGCTREGNMFSGSTIELRYFIFPLLFPFFSLLFKLSVNLSI